VSEDSIVGAVVVVDARHKAFIPQNAKWDVYREREREREREAEIDRLWYQIQTQTGGAGSLARSLLHPRLSAPAALIYITVYRRVSVGERPRSSALAPEACSRPLKVNDGKRLDTLPQARSLHDSRTRRHSLSRKGGGLIWARGTAAH